MKLQPQTSFSSNLHALHFFLTYRDKFSILLNFKAQNLKGFNFTSQRKVNLKEKNTLTIKRWISCYITE